MKSFKVMIAMAAITFCGSASFANMLNNPDQYSVCVKMLVYQGHVDMEQAQRSCASGLRTDGAGFAGCMMNLNQFVGLPYGAAQAQNQKSITATEVCAGTVTDSQFMTCMINGVQQQHVPGEQAVRECAVLTQTRMYKPQSQLTNGALFQRDSDEVIEQRANADLKLYENDPSYRKPMVYQGGSSVSSVSQAQPRQPRRESVPTPHIESQPQVSGSTSMTDLPEVE